MLNFINQEMDFLEIPYEFGEWESEIQYPYFVGELPSPESIETEDGKEEFTLIISGFNRGKVSVLEEIRKQIKAHFDPIYGLRGRTQDGGTIVVYYNGAYYPPTGEMKLKKIEIQLKILYWKGVM